MCQSTGVRQRHAFRLETEKKAVVSPLLPTTHTSAIIFCSRKFIKKIDYFLRPQEQYFLHFFWCIYYQNADFEKQPSILYAKPCAFLSIEDTFYEKHMLLAFELTYTTTYTWAIKSSNRVEGYFHPFDTFWRIACKKFKYWFL